MIKDYNETKQCCANCVYCVEENFVLLYCDKNSNFWDRKLTELYYKSATSKSDSEITEDDTRNYIELIDKEHGCPNFRSLDEHLTTDEKVVRHFTD